MKQDLKAESAVIGALKKDPGLFDKVDIIKDYFTDNKYQDIFVIMHNMYDFNIEINEVSFYEYLKNKKLSLTLISNFTQIENFSTANIEYYIEIIRKNYLLNKFIKLNMEITDRLKNEDPQEMKDFIESYLTHMDDSHKKQIITNQTFILDGISCLQDRREAKVVSVVKTGIEDLDDLIGGYDFGTFNIIASRPNLGKTAFMLFMAYEISRRNQVGIFSLEMIYEKLYDRIAAMSSGFHMYRIKCGFLNDDQFKECIDSMGTYFDRRLYFDDTAYIPLIELRSKIRLMVRMGVRVIFIDYLTLIKYELDNVPRYERIGRLCKELKKLASDNKIIIIALSQISRDGEGKEPTLANLRQSGEIEEDCDNIILMHRKRNSQDTIINVAKNRHGPTGRINLIFEPGTGRFMKGY